MCLTHHEGKSVLAGRLIRTLKNKICKHIEAVSNNVLFNVFYDIADKCNNTYHRTIKMKPIDVKCGSYVEYSIDANAKNANFKIGDRVKISAQENMLCS